MSFLMPTWTRRFAAACAMLLAAQTAEAAELRWLRLDSSRAVYDVLFGAQYRNLGFDIAKQEPIKQVAIILGERLGGVARGSILHPRFLVFDGGISALALHQSRRGYDIQEEGFIHHLRLEYSGTATLRRESTSPLFVTAERGTDIIRRDFVPNYDLLRTAHTANWIWQNGFAPLNLGIAKTSLEYGLGDPGYGADELLQASANARRKMTSSDSALEYRLQEYSNTGKSWLSYKSHDGLASHIWRSDPCEPRRYELDTNLRFLRRTTIADQDQWIGNATGTLWWSDAVTFRGGYRLLQQKAPSASMTQHTAWTDARYRLYRSLTVGTSLQGGSRSLIDGQRNFGSVATDLNYVKKLGSFGTMSHLWQQTYYTERGDNLGGTRDIFGEPHILSTQEPVTLDREKVVRTTVKVIDATTLKQYIENMDYVLMEAGQRLTIRRTTASTIAEGSALRVDYTYEEPSGPGLTSYDNRWVARHTLPIGKDFLAYGEFSKRWTDYQLVGHPSRLDRFENLVLGASGHWRFLDATLEGRRWQALDFRVVEVSALLGANRTVGRMQANLGNRALVQWMAAETWYNYEAFMETALSLGSATTVGGRFRYLARTGVEGLAQTWDGDAYSWWQWRQVRVRVDYRVQANFRADMGTQNHRVFVSVGRPM